MEFLMYFVLRRIFVRTEFSRDMITVTRGLIFRRRYDIPLSAVTKIEIRRTPAIRLFRCRRVEVSTLSGGVYFYLHIREEMPFLPEYTGASVRARPLQSAAGAFVDTRAFSGVITFALLLDRTGSVFGSDSFSRIMSAMFGAAEEVRKMLAALHIGVPRVTALAAVFVSAAWLLAFVRKAVGMMRFRLSCEGGFITVRHGIFTLYEYRLVRNNLTACLRCDTLTTLALGCASLYAHDVLIFPALRRRAADRLLTKMCKLPPPLENRVKPPFSALFGHCAAPLGWLAVFAGALLLTFLAEPTAAGLVQSLLWSGAVISLWYAATYAVYMRRSMAARSGGVTGLAFRRGARLYTAVIPDRKAVYTVTGRNIFQRFSGMCDITVSCAGRKRYKLRNVPYREISEIFTPER